jgi:hypothetical protein
MRNGVVIGNELVSVTILRGGHEVTNQTVKT